MARWFVASHLHSAESPRCQIGAYCYSTLNIWKKLFYNLRQQICKEDSFPSTLGIFCVQVLERVTSSRHNKYSNGPACFFPYPSPLAIISPSSSDPSLDLPFATPIILSFQSEKIMVLSSKSLKITVVWRKMAITFVYLWTSFINKAKIKSTFNANRKFPEGCQVCRNLGW